MKGRYTTQRSFYIGIIRQAVEEYNARFPGWGVVEAIPSHITLETGAMGYGAGAIYQSVEMVEKIAIRLEGEAEARQERQERIRADFREGRITEDVFLSTYYE